MLLLSGVGVCATVEYFNDYFSTIHQSESPYVVCTLNYSHLAFSISPFFFIFFMTAFKIATRCIVRFSPDEGLCFKTKYIGPFHMRGQIIIIFQINIYGVNSAPSKRLNIIIENMHVVLSSDVHCVRQ